MRPEVCAMSHISRAPTCLIRSERTRERERMGERGREREGERR